MNAPTSVYTSLNPESSVVYRTLGALAECESPDLWAWCLNRVAERHSALNLHGQLGTAWHAALRAKNCVALNALAAHPVSASAVSTGLLHTFASHWDVLSDPLMVEQITQHAALARHVVSTAIQRNDWSVAHPLIECVDETSDVAEACLNTKNAFICRWAFSHGVTLTPTHLWEFMRSQVTAPTDVAFFKEMIECDRLWNMGAWSGLIAKHHPTPLFCQAIFYAEELGDLLWPHIDPQWRNSLPLRLAASLGHTQTVKKLLPHSTPQELNSQALALAAHHGYQEIVEILLPHSDSRASHHLALACALWRVVDKNASPTVAQMLMTIETSPQHLRETWEAHCADNEYEFDWFETVMTKWDDGEEDVQDHPTGSIFGDSPAKDIPAMDWEVFDDAVQQWWSFTTPKRIEKMVAVAEKLYPEVLKHHLCDANEKTNRCLPRKI